MSSQAPGVVLGRRYRLTRELARGGMAAVWEAEDLSLGRRVAVKLLHPQFTDEPEFLERFRREARAAASLSHPNIVSVFDVGEHGEPPTPFLVMELIDGQNLKDRIRSAAPLPDADVRRIGAAVAAGLEYAHRRGIIHRDVKPQNILLGEDGRPRLTDFGIAQALASSGLTRTGAVMGTVHYLAPELVRGRPATPASDVYGLGAVLYEMATGRVLFSGETDLAIALAHVEETPPAPRALNASVAPELERTILRALAKQPEERFASAADLAAALQNTTSSPPTARPSASLPRPPWPRLLLAGHIAGKQRPYQPPRAQQSMAEADGPAPWRTPRPPGTPRTPRTPPRVRSRGDVSEARRGEAQVAASWSCC